MSTHGVAHHGAAGASAAVCLAYSGKWNRVGVFVWFLDWRTLVLLLGFWFLEIDVSVTLSSAERQLIAASKSLVFGRSFRESFVQYFFVDFFLLA